VLNETFPKKKYNSVSYWPAAVLVFWSLLNGPEVVRMEHVKQGLLQHDRPLTIEKIIY
jgi:hypothetical protein